MKFYDFPQEYENRQDLFEISCEGRRIPAYGCDVSAVPFNRVWPGHQRSFSQTEKAAYVMLGNDGKTVLKIRPKKAFSRVVVRPLSKKVAVKIEDGAVEATFPSCGQYTVEFDGFHCALAVFINLEKDFFEYKSKPNVLYFPAGVHYADARIMLEDGQTVFLDEGAVLYGSINASKKRDVRVVGYGVLDNSRMQRENSVQSTFAVLHGDEGFGLPIHFDRCENVSVEGVTIVNSSEWSMKFTACKNVCVDNIKLIGMWRYNADGCDFCNCTNASIKNSFLRTFDDSIVVKGLASRREYPVENVLAENCVLWCDWGKCLEVGVETCAPYVKNIVFKNCDLIHGSDVMLDVCQGDGADISNVLFENIRIEYSGEEQVPSIETEEVTEYPAFGRVHVPALIVVSSGTSMWSHDPAAGNIDGVIFKNIEVTAPQTALPCVAILRANEAQSVIANVRFDGLFVNGERTAMKDLRLVIGGNVENVSEESND